LKAIHIEANIKPRTRTVFYYYLYTYLKSAIAYTLFFA